MLKIDDIVWYIPGYAHPYLLAVRCKIVESTDWDSYWLDEPIGHEVSEDELFRTREEAETELECRKQEAKYPVKYFEGNSTLAKFRDRSLAFIVSTYNKNGISHPGYTFVEKAEKDWFS